MTRSFRSNRDGSVAIMTGIALTMVTIATGAALDYSNATSKRHEMQKAADAAVLAAAALPSVDEATRLERAREMFEGSKFCTLHDCEGANVAMKDGTVAITGIARVETSLLKVAGMEKIEVAVDARAYPVTETPIDVVMVLDYSGSMNGSNKYQDMAAAATKFLDNAEEQPGDNLRAGVVPFSKYVLTPIEGRYLFDVSAGNDLTGQNVVGCVLNREHPHSTSVDEPVAATPGSLWPVFSYTVGSSPGSGTYSDVFTGPTVEYGTGTYSYMHNGVYLDYELAIYDSNPDGPVASVIANYILDPVTGIATGMSFDGLGRYHVIVTPTNGMDFQTLNLGPAPAADPFANFGGYGGSTGWTDGDDINLPEVYDQNLLAENLSGDCSQYATNFLWARVLTDEFDTLKSAVASMRPIGLTNIALGLDVGWHMLTPEAPFTDHEKRWHRGLHNCLRYPGRLHTDAVEKLFVRRSVLFRTKRRRRS